MSLTIEYETHKIGFWRGSVDWTQRNKLAPGPTWVLSSSFSDFFWRPLDVFPSKITQVDYSLSNLMTVLLRRLSLNSYVVVIAEWWPEGISKILERNAMFRLWRKSPNVYILYNKLTLDANSRPVVRLSPEPVLLSTLNVRGNQWLDYSQNRF